MPDDRIVAIALLTRSDLARLGDTFTRLWDLGDCSDFSGLLREIDESEERQRLKARQKAPQP